MGGAGRSLGSRLVAALMAAWTSCSATSSGKSRSNCKVISDEPPELDEVIWVKPGIWPNWRSSGEVTNARSEEHTSELQSLMRISYAVFCLKKKTTTHSKHNSITN